MKNSVWKKRVLAFALGTAMLIGGAAAAEELEFNIEDGTFEVSDSEANQKGIPYGYIQLRRGAVVYNDANRKDPLGFPTEECIVYAIRRRVYEKGCLYELRFDTNTTADESKYVKAYYYARSQQACGESARDAALAANPGARIVDGVQLTLIPFHYGAETENESRFNVISANGTVYAAKAGLNLRKGPGRKYGYVTQMKLRTKLTVVGLVNAERGEVWYLVHDDEGNEGFVMASMVASDPVTLTNPEEQPETPKETEKAEETIPEESVSDDGQEEALSEDSAIEDTFAEIEKAAHESDEEEATFGDESDVSEEQVRDGSETMENLSDEEQTADDSDNDAVNEESEDETILNEATEGEATEGEATEGEATEGEATEGEVTEGEATEGEATEGEATEGEATEGEATEGEATEGEATEGEVTEGETAEDETQETPERSVHVSVHWQTKGEEHAIGDMVVLEAVTTGYDDVEPALQWQVSHDGVNWTDVPGENSVTYEIIMTEKNCMDFWRVLATAPEAGQAETEVPED